MGELKLRGVLKGHNGWITSIATTSTNPDRILSGSRDKSIIMWDLKRDEESYGYPLRRLTGHSHFVSDVTVSSDGMFALSGSWDRTLRLWDLNTGQTTKRFISHEGDVLSVAFSPGNRQIVSGSRDKTIKIWNTLGECKYTIRDNTHTEWVSCVRFSPSSQNPLVVSASWDSLVNVYTLNNCKLRQSLVGHDGPVHAVTISPDGSLAASASSDRTVRLWDLAEGKHLYSLEADSATLALAFSPNRYWLVASTQDSDVKIFDLESKSLVDTLRPEDAKPTKAGKLPVCTSMAWSTDGNTLFTGYTDGLIRVWEVVRG